jgi:exodeoxyribonuclease V alpha subunit
MRTLPPAVRQALDRVADRDEVSAFDVAFARLLAGLDAENGGEDPERTRLVALSAALVSAERRRGHSAVSLADRAGGPFPGEGGDPLPRFPSLETWRGLLADSPTVGGPEAACPLVLHEDRLALARFWHAERRVAAAVRARLTPEPFEPSEAVRAAFERLFPSEGRVEGQALAAAAALRSRLLLVAGGPGTGKTFTATRLLALLLAERPSLRIALAAPTGKAAQRLSESLAAGRAALPAGLGEGVPTQASTLHSLLGANLARGGFRHTAARPLPHDVVLVDEGSMVDLPLFDALLAALPAQARLIVLGDPDQLASVEAGAVFSDLCAGGEGPGSPAFAAFCAALGLPGVPSRPEASPLADAVVTLTESRRFGADSGVGRLAAAVRSGDPEAVRAALAGDPEVRHVPPPSAEAALAWVLPHARGVVGSGSPEEALDRLAAFRLLAVVRRGPRGVEGLNAAVEAALRTEGAAAWSLWGEPFYDGRPVLVTANDDATRLANGDVGVCWREGGERVVAFPDGAGGVRRVPFGRLPEHETAWAMTVHKSQGSEFDAVGLALPDPAERGAGLVSRELVYTAVTRARHAVTVFGDAALVAEASPQRRASGLRQRLAEG